MERREREWVSGIALAVLLLLPSVGLAQFSFTTNNGAVTITGYTGSNGLVMIPGTLDGLPVTSIGDCELCRFAMDESSESVLPPQFAVS